MLPYKKKVAQVLVRNASSIGTIRVQHSFLVMASWYIRQLCIVAVTPFYAGVVCLSEKGLYSGTRGIKQAG